MFGLDIRGLWNIQQLLLYIIIQDIAQTSITEPLIFFCCVCFIIRGSMHKFQSSRYSHCYQIIMRVAGLALFTFVILGIVVRCHTGRAHHRGSHPAVLHHWRHLQQEPDNVVAINQFLDQAHTKLLASSIPVAAAVVEANAIAPPNGYDLDTNFAIAQSTGDVKYTKQPPAQQQAADSKPQSDPPADTQDAQNTQVDQPTQDQPQPADPPADQSAEQQPQADQQPADQQQQDKQAQWSPIDVPKELQQAPSKAPQADPQPNDSGNGADSGSVQDQGAADQNTDQPSQPLSKQSSASSQKLYSINPQVLKEPIKQPPKPKQGLKAPQKDSAQSAPAAASADSPFDIKKQALLTPTSAIQKFLSTARSTPGSSSQQQRPVLSVSTIAPSNPYLQQAINEYKPKFILPDNCQIADGYKCIQCVPNAALVGGRCVPVPPNCIDFDATIPKCLRCKPGFKPSGLGCQ